MYNYKYGFFLRKRLKILSEEKRLKENLKVKPSLGNLERLKNLKLERARLYRESQLFNFL